MKEGVYYSPITDELYVVRMERIIVFNIMIATFKDFGWMPWANMPEHKDAEWIGWFDKSHSVDRRF